VFSQGVLLALVEKGLSRDQAYSIVQDCAHRAWNQEGGDFRQFISADDRVTAHLSAAEIAACFDPDRHLRHLDQVYQRLGI
jgi:adenylosuccinate lyase